MFAATATGTAELQSIVVVATQKVSSLENYST